MCDYVWERLAEVYIAEQPESADDLIYCLCSRVSVRNTEIYTALAVEDASDGDDIDGDCTGETLDLYKGSGIETQSVEKHDEEPVSCYCSASHTDNNYSTDEHDSVRDSAHRPNVHSLTQKMGLHQSDSGADLSEYHDQHEAKSIQNLLASYGKTFQATETEIENDYRNVDVLTEYKHLSDNPIVEDTEISHYNPSSKKDKCCPDDSTSFTLGDKELIAQKLSDSIIISNKEVHCEDLISFTQHDNDAYAYPYSEYYGNNKSVMDMAWEQFWAKNGEQLIWTSWIEKYADYINPDYFQNNARATENEKLQNTDNSEAAVEKYYEQNTCFPNQAHNNCELVHSNFAGIFNKSNSNGSQLKTATTFSSNTSFSFDQSIKPDDVDNDVDGNRKNITTEVLPHDGDNEGWNPLSPFSIEESYNQHSNMEDERLLTRCDSITGSIAKTNATSDSMTNVTKMTLTSSSCDSNSTHSSSLVSSFESSSIESNTTNSGSDQENEVPVEDDKYWQHLWKEHFQLQYQQQYELFVVNYKKEHNINCDQTYLELSKYVSENPVKEVKSNRSDKHSITQTDNMTIASSKINTSGNKNISKNTWSSKSESGRTKRLILDSVGTLMKNLSMKSEDQPTDAEDKSIHKTKEQTQDQTSAVTSTERGTMASSNSISSYQQKSSDGGGDGDQPHENKPVTLKRRHAADLDENEKGLETVKKAFSLMGYAFDANHEQTNWQGEVVYRKRNVRLQNRQSKMNFNRSKPMNKHIYFDAQSNEAGSYAKARFTSSSDEESDPSPKTKLQAKRLVFSKPSTSSVECDILDVSEDADVFNYKEPDTSADMEIEEKNDEDNIKKTQKKKRRKQPKRNINPSVNLENFGPAKLPMEIENDRTLMKYWLNRYHLFSKFDQGIKLDSESWYSVTPESIAKHIAERCRCDVIIDAFCGAGGNCIQFAFTCEKVIAIDIDPSKIQLARNNARIYGVEDRIEFIVGDFVKLAPKFVADVVFLSPPWGGPGYMEKGKIYDLKNILPYFGGVNLFKLAKGITDHIAYYLPRNVDTMQLIRLAGKGGEMETEQYLFGSKLVALTAYYGELPL